MLYLHVQDGGQDQVRQPLEQAQLQGEDPGDRRRPQDRHICQQEHRRWGGAFLQLWCGFQWTRHRVEGSWGPVIQSLNCTIHHVNICIRLDLFSAPKPIEHLYLVENVYLVEYLNLVKYLKADGTFLLQLSPIPDCTVPVST